DLEHAPAAPAFEVGEARDMRLYEVLPRLDLVEVLPATDGSGRMADVAGATIPVVPDLLDWHLVERRHLDRGLTCPSEASRGRLESRGHGLDGQLLVGEPPSASPGKNPTLRPVHLDHPVKVLLVRDMRYAGSR